MEKEGTQNTVTHKELASILGISVKSSQKRFNGIKKRTLRDVADIIGISVYELLQLRSKAKK